MVFGKIKTVKTAYRRKGLEGIRRAIFDHYGRDYPFLAAKARYYLRCIERGPTLHPFAIYMVDPNSIDRTVRSDVFSCFRNAARVHTGTWDLDAEPLQSFGKYVLINRYLTGDLDAEDLTSECLFEHGYPETEATLYPDYGYGSYLDELHRSIAEDGFQMQPREPVESPTAKYDYVAVDIARDGELLFDQNGCHRMIIASILGLDQIPVRINAIHREWYAKHGLPESHPELTHRCNIPIRWRELPALETASTKPPIHTSDGSSC